MHVKASAIPWSSLLDKPAGALQALGCGPGEHAAAVAQLQAERRGADKARKALAGELAEAHGAALAARTRASGSVAAYHRHARDHCTKVPVLESVL